MKLGHKIAFLSICLLLVLPWISTYATPMFHIAIEKESTNNNENLPQNEVDSEYKTFEFVCDYIPHLKHPSFDFTTTKVLAYSLERFAKTLYLDISNPPPEL